LANLNKLLLLSAFMLVKHFLEFLYNVGTPVLRNNKLKDKEICVIEGYINEAKYITLFAQDD
jgi:hypothetical protein